jgi:hypothetical protein
MLRIDRKLAFATLCLAGLAACTDRDGPAENLGERIDDAVSEGRERAEDVGDELEEAADEIRDALQDN